MKITCQSCGAKYTIADEKVRGRTVKIRCKKCSTAIVVKGPEPEGDEDRTVVYAGARHSAPPQAQEWTVSLDDGDQRTVTADEISQLAAAGTINSETYAWRDGMDDWLAIRDIPELAALAGGQEPAADPSPAPSSAAQSEPSPGYAPLAAAGFAPQAGFAPEASPGNAPDARMTDGLFGGGGTREGGAARVSARRNQDLFGGQPSQMEEGMAAAGGAVEAPSSMSPLDKSAYTAERGENSVLFTIDALKAAAHGQPAQSSTKPIQPSDKPPESSDIVDLRALTEVAPSRGPDSHAGYSDVMNIGGDLVQASLAPPSLPTTIEPDPVPIPLPTSASYPPPQKQNKGLIIGLVAGLGALGLLVFALGGYAIFGGDDEEDGATAALTTGTADPEETAKNDETKPASDETGSAGSKGDTPETANTGEAKPDDDKKTKRVPGPLKKPDDKKPEAKKPEEKPEEKKPDKKPDKKPEAPSGPVGPFNRGAAISALSSAAGSASGCKKKGGPTGRGRVSVPFANSGRATSAVVNGPPFAGTSTGSCVASVFRRARVPAFTGSPVTVHKSFSIR